MSRIRSSALSIFSLLLALIIVCCRVNAMENVCQAAGSVLSKAPVIFVPHGGGPLPVLGDPKHQSMVSFMTNQARQWLGNPRAILLVTAHWETTIPTISSGSKPSLMYDYFGFPPESYSLKYDAPGSPEVANLVFEHLSKAGIRAKLDDKRGWDHGVFIPLLLLRPSADIPVVQISVDETQNPEFLFEFGKALAPLRNEGVAIVGSGMSYHNIRSIFANTVKGNLEFESALEEVMKMTPGPEKEERVKQWTHLPFARDCHPRGQTEHFSPLIVCSGVAHEDELREYALMELMNIKVSAFLW